MLQAAQLGLGRDQLALQRGCPFDHGSALLLDIERHVLTGELAQVLRRDVQFFFDAFQAVLDKHPLAMSSRGVELCGEVIQGFGIGPGQLHSPLRRAVSYADADDSAFPVFNYVCAIGQNFTGTLPQASAVAVEAIDQGILDCAALKNTYVQSAGSFHSQGVGHETADKRAGFVLARGSGE